MRLSSKECLLSNCAFLDSFYCFDCTKYSLFTSRKWVRDFALQAGCCLDCTWKEQFRLENGECLCPICKCRRCVHLFGNYCVYKHSKEYIDKRKRDRLFRKWFPDLCD